MPEDAFAKKRLRSKFPKFFSFLKRMKYIFYPHGFCPFCNQIVALRPGGRPVLRKGDICVDCGSMARHRFLFYVYEIIFLSQARPGAKVLHSAPELPFYRLLSRNPNIDYICGDIEPAQYPFATDCRKVNALKTPFADESFDVVLANHLIEHVDEELFLKEMGRIIKKDGVILLSTPVYVDMEKTLEDAAISTPEQRRREYGHSMHLRKYGADAAERFGKFFDVNYVSHKSLPPFGDKINSNCFILKKKSVSDI